MPPLMRCSWHHTPSESLRSPSPQMPRPRSSSPYEYCSTRIARTACFVTRRPARSGLPPTSPRTKGTHRKGLCGVRDAVRCRASRCPAPARIRCFTPPSMTPGGDCRERLAVQPVVGADGHTHAVMVAVRSPGRTPFDAQDLARLEALAHAISMHLVKLELRLEAEEVLGETLDRGPSDVF